MCSLYDVATWFGSITSKSCTKLIHDGRGEWLVIIGRLVEARILQRVHKTRNWTRDQRNTHTSTRLLAALWSPLVGTDSVRRSGPASVTHGHSFIRKSTPPIESKHSVQTKNTRTYLLLCPLAIFCIKGADLASVE